MLGFVVKRLFWSALLVAVITLITFIIFLILPEERRSGQTRQGLVSPNLQRQFDLENRSLPGKYVHFLERVVLHGDLGSSLRQPITVREIIGKALPVTVSLVVGGTLLFLLLAFPIGIFSALRPRSMLDKGMMIFVLIGVSAHPVWLGSILAYFLGFKWDVFPLAGYCDFVYNPASSNLCGGPDYWAYHLILPWITFALIFAALYARMIRANMLEAMHEDYVRTARAKGAGTWRVLRKHVLRNSLLPVVTMMGMDVALAFSGALFIETIFELPGMGQVLYRALQTNDLPVVMGIVIVVSIAVTIANLIIDILYAVIDPRVRLQTREKRRMPALGGRLRPQPQVKESPTQAG